ncbi:MAG: bacterial transcriptional activator domain-containing protein [Thermoanaerobaculum sp.]|nr:bacterial transcriptional activator domain-containing protein [Thermoanaerobaculum sp.]MDW7966711.1 bacterial transcriptional activator domain-containing protein [Thermoanaerobaculum sp.]
MKRLFFLVGLWWTAASSAAVFERYLDPNQPRDRAILNYLELDRQGKAGPGELTELGVLLVDKGFPEDGVAYLRKAVRLDRRHVEARYRLGLALQRLGQDRAAVRQYRQVVKARPGFAEAQFMLALALERCGERQEAIRAYAKAYKHNPALADPARNPLVYDSRLQTQAKLVRYQKDVTSATLKLLPLDPQAVRQMMWAKPPEPPPQAPVSAPVVPEPRGQAPVSSPPAPSAKAGPGREGQAPLLPAPNVSRPVQPRRGT